MAWRPWGDEMTSDSIRGSTRPSRPNYVPPHLRHTSTNIFSNVPSNRFSNDSNIPASSFQRFHSGPRAQLPPSRGRGRGRGRGRAPSSSSHKVPPTDPNLGRFDIADKFDELQVREDVGTGSADNGTINFDAYEDIPVEVSGQDIPSPVSTFAEIDLGHDLSQNIKRCKYVKPTPIQRHAIPIAVAGRDLMACAQTGSGKTAAFCFPIICRILKNRTSVLDNTGGEMIAGPAALIISPTRELSCQIYEEAKKFAYQTGVRIVVAYGGAPISQQFRDLEKGVDILVATPGRLVDMIERGRVSLSMIKYLALDEADRMLDMGFEPQIRKIVERMGMPSPEARQTMLFSATFPDEIQKLASDFLSNYIFLAVGRVGSSTDLISQRVELVQDMDKRSHLINLLHTQKANGSHGKYALTLVFVETKRGADALEQWLAKSGFPAIAIHGDKMQMERERALRSFKTGATPILVATDVASRGLDIPHVAHVINFDLPRNIDDYVHRIGRTGRAGKSGVATAFFSDKNQQLAKSLSELMKEAKQEVPSWLDEYAQTSSFSDGGAGRSYGESKFGGLDYRRGGGRYGSENYNYGATYGNDSYGVGYGVSTAGSQDYGFGHTSIVATGWD